MVSCASGLTIWGKLGARETRLPASRHARAPSIFFSRAGTLDFFSPFLFLAPATQANPKWHKKTIESTFADRGLFNFKNMDKLICHLTQK